MLDAIPWYVFLLFLAAVVLPMAFMWVQASKEERLLARAGLTHVRKMAWPDFQRYLESLFAGLGYRVERTPQRGDYGADLILRDGTGRRTAVNARHFKEKVGPEVLVEVSEGAEYHHCQDTLVVSAMGFTNKAIDAADQSGAILWDAGDLAESMDKVRARPSFQTREQGRPVPEQQPVPATVPVAAAREIPLPAGMPVDGLEFEGPPCPICGKPMEAKMALGRDIWLCKRFPRCNGAEIRDGGGGLTP